MSGRLVGTRGQRELLTLLAMQQHDLVPVSPSPPPPPPEPGAIVTPRHASDRLPTFLPQRGVSAHASYPELVDRLHSAVLVVVVGDVRVVE